MFFFCLRYETTLLNGLSYDELKGITENNKNNKKKKRKTLKNEYKVHNLYTFI